MISLEEMNSNGGLDLGRHGGIWEEGEFNTADGSEGQEGKSSSGVVDMGSRLTVAFSKQLLTGLDSECEDLGIFTLFHR